ncbi:OsmC family protein [soil metagenome]
MADVKVGLRWSGTGLQFSGGSAGGPEIAIDGDGRAGVSPVTSLLLAVAGCMGADVVDIGRKMRLTLEALTVEVEADRRAEPPRRLMAVRLMFIATGVLPEDEGKLWRAIDLSRDTYCSVLHSLREDVSIQIGLELR